MKNRSRLSSVPRELDAPVAARDVEGVQVEAEVLELEHSPGGRLVVRRESPAQQGAHPRPQFGQGERLDEVVVRTGVEPVHAIAHGLTRGHHQDRRVVARVPHAPCDLEPVEPGEADVEEDEVVGAFGELLERGGAVVGRGRGIAIDPKGTGDGVAHMTVVVDDEDGGGGARGRSVHGSTVTSGASPYPRSGRSGAGAWAKSPDSYGVLRLLLGSPSDRPLC